MRVSTSLHRVELPTSLAPPKDVRSAQTDRLDDFLRPFAATFRRRDQARLFRVYLRALLHDAPRKSIEAMVRALESDLDIPIGDLSQALQNFLNQSPWDERALWRQLRHAAADCLGATPWIGVLDEVSFVKQGQHSVGVQRQYAEDGDRKQNCQVAIVLTAVAPEGAFPLACRLYLPRNWSGNPHRLRAAGVPDENQPPATRGQIALSLVDEVMAEGFRFRAIVAAARYGATRDFRERLERSGVPYLVAVNDDLLVHSEAPHGGPRSGPQPVCRIEPCGAWSSIEEDREIGRASPIRFAGQRARLVEGADSCWLLIEQNACQDRRHFLVHGDAEFRLPLAEPLLKSRYQAQRAWRVMKARFGLDHFEGRSWRGFHHHAALVALAYWHSFVEHRNDAVSRDVVV
jgi:SRSO17 transposase